MSQHSSHIIHYNNCPVCHSSDLVLVLSAKDHTVSQRSFDILECNNCSLRFTQDVPDSAQIGAYYKSEDYISHTNTGRGLINRTYRLVRTYTLWQKRRLVERFSGVRRGRLLDLGSGTGAFVHEMADHGWRVTGMEPDEGARMIAREQFGEQLEDTSGFLQLPDATFDAITLWHVLEHMHDLHGAMDNLERILATGGTLFIAVPNYTSLDSRRYGQHWAAYDVPRHLYHFSPQAMDRLAAMHRLKVVGKRPMWFDSFYVSLLSSRYQYGKVRLMKAIANGLQSNLNALRHKERCSSVIYVLTR